jgi:glycosyltransferase involved in cell wall biosynthesis
MKILILTQWYPPEPALQLQELAQTLQTSGHEVMVLTGFPNYPSGTLYPGYRLRWRQRETVAGVPVLRVSLYPEHGRSGAGRVLNYVSFALSSALLGPWLLKRPSVIFVYHPPLTIGLPAFVLSRLWRVPFVYQIQDMWPETLSATGMLTNPQVLRWVGQFARWVYARAKSILVISPGFRCNLLDKGVPASKVHFIPNWVDTETYHPAEPEPELAAELGLAGRFNIMFAGNVGEAQGLETVIEAANLLRHLRDIQFVIVGDGIALPGLQQAAQVRNLSNVRFLGRYPDHAMSRLYALADVLLVHLKDDPLFRITIPHKTLAYLATGKPILAAVSGDAADLITNEGAGLACPPSDPVALAETVHRFRALGPDELCRMGKRGLAVVQEKYKRPMVISQIEAVLRSAADQRN